MLTLNGPWAPVSVDPDDSGGSSPGIGLVPATGGGVTISEPAGPGSYRACFVLSPPPGVPTFALALTVVTDLMVTPVTLTLAARATPMAGAFSGEWANGIYQTGMQASLSTTFDLFKTRALAAAGTASTMSDLLWSDPTDYTRFGAHSFLLTYQIDGPAYQMIVKGVSRASGVFDAWPQGGDVYLILDVNTTAGNTFRLLNANIGNADEPGFWRDFVLTEEVHQ